MVLLVLLLELYYIIIIDTGNISGKLLNLEHRVMFGSSHLTVQL